MEIKKNYNVKFKGVVETLERKIQAFCSRMCVGRCGILVEIKGGEVYRVKGDPLCPLNEGFACSKAFSLPAVLNHSHRLLHPLIRAGRRGEGKWRKISWDEALSITVNELKKVKERYGAESLAIFLGAPKGFEYAFAYRFATAFGTPNVAQPGNVCFMPRTISSIITYGSTCLPDLDSIPACIIVWGANPYRTRSCTVGRKLKKALQNGSKLIVIDPYRTELADRANIWLRIKPGADGALALGMLKVIVENGLYDKEFVENWTIGFDRLTEHLKSYTLEWVEEKTWIPKERIVKAAMFYAENSPATILWGNGLEQSSNSFQACRAICILRAITGNLDVPGGDLLRLPPPVMPLEDFALLKKFPRSRMKCIGREKIKLADKFLMLAPSREHVIHTILTEEPYPIKAALIFGSNPLLSCPGGEKVRKALLKLDFLMVSEIFMTPTAKLADIVLPAAFTLEFDELCGYIGTGPIVANQEMVKPRGECWPDVKIINALGRRLGLSEYFYEDYREAFDAVLKACGVTFKGLKEAGFLKEKKEYKKYERVGFKTPSGKVEIFSQQLSELGYSPLPVYHEAFSQRVTQDYPLLLTTYKHENFFHSAFRNVEALRRSHPDPTVEIHPNLADKLGVNEGEWVYIETEKGRIRQKVKLNSFLDERVIICSYGWWFPENGDWRKSNINMLIDFTETDPVVGSTHLRGVHCEITTDG